MEGNKSLFVVGIGASAGGLEATQNFFKNVTAGSQAAFILVQHLSPDFKSMMDELLAKHTDLPIQKIETPMPVEPGHIYLMSAQKNVIIKDGILTPVDNREKHKVNLPIDQFFHSLGKDQRNNAIGIVLSGTGTDGSRGIKTIYEQGGIVLVQAPAEAQFDGMPQAALQSGVTDFTLPVRQIAAEVNRLVGKNSPPRPPVQSSALLSTEEDYLEEIIRKILFETKIDFSHYRRETILRRLTKRQLLVRCSTIRAYHDYVQEHPQELKQIAKEFLIGVSSFFRDPKVWEGLAQRALPEIIAQKKDQETIRVWVAGCSTGEEAYTLGMLLNEAIRKSQRLLTFKIFATDLNAHAIAQSGKGMYGENAVDTIPSALVNRYFHRLKDGIQVKKEFREQLVFAVHNFLSDPPFIRMDIISCRNALIYIQPNMQQQVIKRFRFALRPQGILVLGKSEGLGSYAQAFESLSGKHKVFRQSAQPAPADSVQQLVLHTAITSPEVRDKKNEHEVHQSDHDYYTDLLAEQYAPASIFVNQKLDVLYIHGDADRYLKLPRRKVQMHLERMLDAEPAALLKSGIEKAKEQDTPVIFEEVAFSDHQLLDIKFVVCQPTYTDAPLVLIEFRSHGKQPSVTAQRMNPDEATTEHIRQLERKLKENKSKVQALKEELDVSNEELQASNEELISSNEELQSSNEELQSMNEELYTINTELQEKVEELISINTDVDNLLRSTRIATLFLDQNLRIRMFTPAIGEIIKLGEQDIGRAIDHFSIDLQNSSLLDNARTVLAQGQPIEKEVATHDQKRFLLRIFPYLKDKNTTDGLVITLINLTEIKKAHQAVQDAKNYAESIVDSVREPLIVLNDSLKVVSANPSFYQMFAVTPEKTIGHRIYELSDGEWNIDELRSLLEQVIPDNTIVTDYLIEREFPAIGQRVMQLNAVRVLQASDLPGLILLSIRDITQREMARRQERKTAQRLDMVLDSSKTGIWEWDFTGDVVTVNDHWRVLFDLCDSTSIHVQQVLNSVHPDDLLQVTRAIEQAKLHNQFYREDFRLVRDSGEIVYVNGQGSVIRDEHGTPTKMLGTNVDITEKKLREEKLRLSEERLAMAASGTSDGIFDYYNIETGESWWSPRVYELLGLPAGKIEANAKSFKEFVHPKDRHLSKEAQQAFVEHGKPYDVEHRVKHATLGYRWFRSRANIVLNEYGEITRMVGAFADIHERKTYELTLKQTNRKLLIANEYLDNFVFMAAHDLRSPVANLKSLTNLWQAGHDNQSTIIEKVDRSVARLDATLNGLIQILDVQQYEHEKISELSFTDLYQKLQAELEPAIETAQARIDTNFAEPNICYIEPFLESTLRNLLRNAIDYRSPERPAKIALRTRRENGFVVLEVEDNGVGIDLKRGRNKLFKAFERLTHQGEGQGIGMHLVKNMVEKNEGFIEVKSEIDQGTLFTVYLRPYEGE